MWHNSPTSLMRDEATQLASVAHHDGKCDDASHIGIDGSVADSEYLSPLCNPCVSSLHAEASSRAIVDINDSVVDINNLAPPLPTPTLAIPTPSISLAHVQDQDLGWNSSLPQIQLSLTSRCFAKPWMVALSLFCVWLSYNRLDNILI